MPEHPYGWLSVLPPVVAIVLAIATRRVLVSLLAGIYVGALVIDGGNPFSAAGDTILNHLWPTLCDGDKLRILGFTLLMGAMIAVVNRSGGMRGLVEAISPWAKNRRRGQLTIWLLGLLVFFDDYANTMLLGNTLRPLCDRLKISREKLAYLVDSTSAPVAGLALISTWVAGEIEFVQEGIDRLTAVSDLKALELFLASIPYRFYTLWTLAFVGLVAWLGRDFGPMLPAERARLADSAIGSGRIDDQRRDPTAPDPATPARWFNAVVPVAVTVGGIVWLLHRTGLANLLEANPRKIPTLMDIFGAALPYEALLWGSLAGLATAVGLSLIQRLLSVVQVVKAATIGARLMLTALAMLWLASTLSVMTGEGPSTENAVVLDGPDRSAAVALAEQESAPPPTGKGLYTGRYLTGLLGDRLPAALLPTVVFVLSAGVAFATGTSWGTMGIIMPLAIPLSYGILSEGGGAVSPDDPILVASIGGVLAGAIFGDHCSPISDTTVLSSQASGCDHIAHVWTQLPYALSVGAVSILFGTLPVGFGVSVWVLLPLGTVALVVCLLVFGKRVDAAPE